ncbi:hypothetical protein [Winogradskyella luteola]|uniref:Uncharacterized protein n=1 Tax=Winogradskyella luteola TaxID=2828330 RepID=A0A9X1FAV0_9FLAO|nr:hypothetical protein [Winogradskyella luteola]MBV7270649.1 hypothetical protein [Winogradskyella luteola]
MDDNKKQLMKHFATALRNRALEKETESPMGRNLVFHFSRKELIEILKKKFGGTVPKEHNLAEMENRELLELIGNELFIISYVTEKWSKEEKQDRLVAEKSVSEVAGEQRPKPVGKKERKVTRPPKGN